nr:Transposon Ty3-G Gag-Pol polyprotein [Ipomoea batatas]
MSDNQTTATHPWEQAITELQENFDRQTVTNHQLIQKLINSVSRLETMVTTNTNAVVQPQVQGILGPSPDTHLQPSMQTENGQGTQRSVQTENGQGTQRFHIKLELPRFDGSDPHGWVFRIQEYFDFYDTPDTQRLRIAGFTMEGKASEWYQWMKKNKLLTTWKEFLQNVTKRFGESRFEDFQGKLSKLTQQTTVTTYQAEFERLMNKVTGIAEPILLSMFIAGLKPLIRREVQMARPTTLMEAFDLA